MALKLPLEIALPQEQAPVVFFCDAAARREGGTTAMIAAAGVADFDDETVAVIDEDTVAQLAAELLGGGVHDDVADALDRLGHEAGATRGMACTDVRSGWTAFGETEWLPAERARALRTAVLAACFDEDGASRWNAAAARLGVVADAPDLRAAVLAALDKAPA